MMLILCGGQMADSIMTYLLALDNFGKYANEDRAIELVQRYSHQIESDLQMFLDKFPAGTRVGDLIRQVVDDEKGI